MKNNSTIQLSHGEGGLATSRLIQKEIISRFGNPILDKLEDGCLIPVEGNQVVVSTDSFIVDPIIFPGGDIGKLSIAGTVNDIVASGAVPKYLTFSLILGVGLEISTFRQILDSAKVTADLANVKIVAGDTKVLKLSNQFKVIINTTGVGFLLKKDSDYSISNVKEGDDIIVTGNIGDHSLAVLSLREGLGFEQRVISDCASLDKLILPLIEKYDGIRSMRDPTRGGIAGVLIDIAEAANVDLHIEEKKIPVQHEVQFGCEMLGIDPLRLVNEGKMVVVADPEQSDEILEALSQNELGKQSKIIGKVRKAKNKLGRVIINNGKTNKLLTRLEGEPIPRLC